MDTKLKNSNKKTGINALLFVLVVALVVGVAHTGVKLLEVSKTGNYLDESNYYDTWAYYVDTANYIYKALGESDGNSEVVDLFGLNRKEGVRVTYRNGVLKTTPYTPKLEHFFDVPSEPSQEFDLFIPKSAFNREATVWEKNRTAFNVNIYCLIGLTVAIFALVAVLFYRTPARQLTLDRAYTELLLLAGGGAICLWGVYANSFIPRYGADTTTVVNVLFYAFTAAVATVVGTCLLALVRKIKCRTFFKGTLLFTLLAGIAYVLNAIVKAGMGSSKTLTENILWRAIVFIVGSFLCVLAFFLLLVNYSSVLFLSLPLLAESVLIYFLIRGNYRVLSGADEALEAAVEERLKSERMKIDLVTNMSHDLKTPLTSIISYVDLLKKEPLESTAAEYVDVLEGKSAQLKSIVSDLFDLSKSTSGNLDIQRTPIDLNKLLRQSLGNMQEEIERSELKIITSDNDAPVWVYSDGAKLHRVFQNLLENILKYTLRGTRVFITLETVDTSARIQFKNISEAPITVTPEAILRRFARGDTSRGSEGSGLGLSIAESFTRACGGDFQLDIDGDLFKVTLTFEVIEHVAEATSEGLQRLDAPFESQDRTIASTGDTDANETI